MPKFRVWKSEDYLGETIASAINASKMERDITNNMNDIDTRLTKV